MCLMASGSLLPSIDHLDSKHVDKNVLYYSYEWYKEFYNLYSELGAKLFVQLSIDQVILFPKLFDQLSIQVWVQFV